MGYGVSACATCDGFFFKDKERGGGRRRRHRDGGGELPHQVRHQRRRSCTAATSCAPRRSCRTARTAEPEDRVRVERRGRRRARRCRRAAASPASCSRTRRPARSATIATDGLFIAIGHEPNTQLFEGQLDMDERGYVITEPRSDRTRTCPASSPAATCRTRPTARRSRPRARAAWRRSTPSAGSKPSTADQRERRTRAAGARGDNSRGAPAGRRQLEEEQPAHEPARKPAPARRRAALITPTARPAGHVDRQHHGDEQQVRREPLDPVLADEAVALGEQLGRARACRGRPARARRSRRRRAASPKTMSSSGNGASTNAATSCSSKSRKPTFRRSPR